MASAVSSSKNLIETKLLSGMNQAPQEKLHWEPKLPWMQVYQTIELHQKTRDSNPSLMIARILSLSLAQVNTQVLILVIWNHCPFSPLLYPPWGLLLMSTSLISKSFTAGEDHSSTTSSSNQSTVQSLRTSSIATGLFWPSSCQGLGISLFSPVPTWLSCTVVLTMSVGPT